MAKNNDEKSCLVVDFIVPLLSKKLLKVNKKTWKICNAKHI